MYAVQCCDAIQTFPTLLATLRYRLFRSAAAETPLAVEAVFDFLKSRVLLGASVLRCFKGYLRVAEGFRVKGGTPKQHKNIRKFTSKLETGAKMQKCYLPFTCLYNACITDISDRKLFMETPLITMFHEAIVG